MQCPSCKRVYRIQDFGRDESYFECDVCNVPLDGAPEPIPPPTQTRAPILNDPLPSTRLGNLIPITPEDYSRTYDTSIVVVRWLGTLVDYVILFGILWLANFLIGNALGLVTLIVWVLFALAYYSVLEGLTGQTVGKLMVNTRVVDGKGQPPGIGRATIRALFRLIEVNPFFFGGLPAGICVLATKTHQRLGDLVAGTFVLKGADATRIRNRGF